MPARLNDGPRLPDTRTDQARILCTLLPYERSKLKSIVPSSVPADLSKLTDEELNEFARLYSKITGEDCGAAEIETPKFSAAKTNHRQRSTPARALRFNQSRHAGAPPNHDDRNQIDRTGRKRSRCVAPK
jgi:hypothetical protein